VTRVGEDFLGALPQFGDRPGNAREKTGFVEKCVAVVFSSRDLEAFRFEFAEVQGKSFIEGAVFFSCSGFGKSGIGFC
jgi:hypothetical protein